MEMLSRIFNSALKPAAIMIGGLSWAVLWTINSWQEPPPITLTQTSAFAYTNNARAATTVEYTVEYEVARAFAAMVSKSVECLSDKVKPYDAGVELRSFAKGQQHTERFFEIPAQIPEGTKCQIVFSVDYKPWLSLNSKVYEVARISVVVTKGI